MSSARRVSIDTEFLPARRGASGVGLPQAMAIIAQGNSREFIGGPTITVDTTPRRITSNAQARALYGGGSPLTVMVAAALADGGGVPITAYPLLDDPGAARSGGEFILTGEAVADGTLVIHVGGFSSAPIDIPAFIDNNSLTVLIVFALIAVESELPVYHAVLVPPVPATEFTGIFDCKWEGESGNDIALGFTLTGARGLNIELVAMGDREAGLVDPDPTSTLLAIGGKWESMVASGIASAGAVDIYHAWGEGRRVTEVQKPSMVFMGNNAADLSDPQAITDGREQHRNTAIIHAPESLNTPWQIAARACSVVANAANADPAHDFNRLSLAPILGGELRSYTDRDASVLAGVATVRDESGVLVLSDVVTMYRPTPNVPHPWSDVVDLVKLSAVIYRIRREFEGPRWNGAPLVPDGQTTINPDARSPKAMKSLVAAVLDGLAAAAVLSDPGASKDSLRVSLGSSNPRRVDISLTVQLSGSGGVFAIDLDFGFGAPIGG